jgi:hypothetical protein
MEAAGLSEQRYQPGYKGSLPKTAICNDRRVNLRVCVLGFCLAWLRSKRLQLLINTDYAREGDIMTLFIYLYIKVVLTIIGLDYETMNRTGVKWEQRTRYTYNIMLRRFSVTIVAVKKKKLLEVGSGLWNVVLCVCSEIIKQWEKFKNIVVMCQVLHCQEMLYYK